MTTLQEMVKAEAARAEAEPEPEPEPEPDDSEPEDAPEPADDALGEPEGFNVQAFEREQTRHEKALAKAFGPAFGDMRACDTCGGVGWTPQDFTPMPEVLADPTLVVCPDCNGYGARLTPSHAENYRTIPCTGCQGHGYQDRGVIEAEERARAYQAAQAYATPPPPPVWNPMTARYEDASGQPVSIYPSAPVLPSPTA